MLLLWSDILTHAVCAEQAKQQNSADRQAKPLQPKEAANHTGQPRAPCQAHSRQKALDWEIKDISVHRSRCTHIPRLSKENTHMHRGGWKRVGVGVVLPGVLILICMQTPNRPVANSSASSFLFCLFLWEFTVEGSWLITGSTMFSSLRYFLAHEYDISDVLAKT